MNRRVSEVGEESQGLRLDRYLAEIWSDYSRSFWQRQINLERVTVDGRAARAGLPLKAGQTVQVMLVPESSGAPFFDAEGPREWPSFVVYHDAQVIVVNKPRALVVHPSAGHRDNSVVHQLIPWLPVADGEVRPGVVHRLDRDTTGLLVLARSAQAREKLSLAIQTREVTREYLAVVRGHLDPPSGVIDAPVGRDPRQRLRMAIVLNGRAARTHYRTVALWHGFSLVQCTLETGRTHQIRVHLASLGHPLAGDVLYGGRNPMFGEGQLLHAGRLRFVHPARDELMEFVAPVPDDWKALGQLGAAAVVDSALYRGAPLATGDWLTQLGVVWSSLSP